VATVNRERMPMLLTREDEFETWLKASIRSHAGWHLHTENKFMNA
jgi:hypothetical protein